MADRRSTTRADLGAPGTIDLGDRVLPCQVLDLSEAGIAVLTDDQALPYGPVQVRFRLGGSDAAEASIDAMIVRRLPWKDERVGAVWGLRLLPMDIGTRTRVRDYVLGHAAA
jgi:hypothetical protein